MLYEMQIDNFAWAALVDPLSNLFGKGVDKINDQKHIIGDMWSEWQQTQQAQAQALALQRQLEAQQQTMDPTLN
jgi:hypothetical protein